MQSAIGSTSAVAIREFTLSATSAAQLEVALNADAIDSYYSANVSLGDALAGINRRFFSWATVKLYYTVFYSLRALMALDGHCLFHIGSAPKWIQAIGGSQPSKAAKSSHLAVLQYFEKNYPHHPLMAQPIGLDLPLVWLRDRRVEANYTNRGFGEPHAPEHFEQVELTGVRQAIEAYLADRGEYLFDPDHAMLAFPLKALQLTGREMVRKKLELEEGRSRFLQTVAFKDKMGPIAKLQDFLK